MTNNAGDEERWVKHPSLRKVKVSEMKILALGLNTVPLP